MKPKQQHLIFLIVILLLLISCATFGSTQSTDTPETGNGGETQSQEAPVIDYQPTADEPVQVTGTIPFTSPFFMNLTAEPFVMLEDQTGFVARNKDFVFPLDSQVIGPVWTIDDHTLGFSLSLPEVPQGTLVDVDHDGQEDTGVMVFGVAFWSNIWGGPFLEKREGTGWSTANTSTITDPDRDYEITGGHLIIWAPDDTQSFPSGFGADQKLFTDDDPIQDVPAGYSIVDLNSEPFKVYKEPDPVFELVEGPGEVKDYSRMSYVEAFDTMFDKIRVEYPFTVEKNVDWDALYEEFQPRMEDARNNYEFFLAVHDFSLSIPDSHIGVGSQEFISRLFMEQAGGSFGMRLAELSDGRIIVIHVYDGYPAAQAGIQVGAEIISWNGKPVQQALNAVVPMFGPFSTPQHARQDQLTFLTRYPLDTTISVEYKNPDQTAQVAALTAVQEYDSYFDTFWYYNADPMALPLEAKTLPGGVVYINISTFSDNYNLMAQTWDRYIKKILDTGNVPGVILDLRTNSGGSSGLASAFAGYFVNKESDVYRTAYYNHDTGKFEYTNYPAKLEPGPEYYSGQLVVLVSPTCVSACEGFAYMLSLNHRATIIGNAPTAGAYGEVGRGQYKLPGDISVQFPTGRSETMDGKLIIEGVGVIPDITVPVTYESALGQEDTVLQTAVDFLTGNQ